MMTKRPKLVTILSILIIVLGSLTTILHLLQFINNQELPEFSITIPESIKFFIYFIGSFSLLFSGILIYKGEDLGRIILIIWCVFAIFIIGGSLIPRIVYLIISALIIFNKKSNTYFKETTKIRF